MAAIKAHNIISPLGFTSEDNYQALSHGNSSILVYNGLWDIPEPFSASLFNKDQRESICIPGLSFFESLAIKSISTTILDYNVDVSDSRTCLILSTTKADIENNAGNEFNSAQTIAKQVGFTTTPIVVSNACISGGSALLLGNRLVDCGIYNTVIICGCDVQGKFIASGFLSLKAVSQNPCRPFDMERNGLSLGEAAATIILQKGDGWNIHNGAVRNDAYHISTPSPIGKGCSLALASAVQSEEVGLINLHGTATLYNDQMESKAISGLGLSQIPANALKGYLGHTMGATGVLETIITLLSIQDEKVLPTHSFEELGVSGKVKITNEEQKPLAPSFVKLLSGFGGGNCALFINKKQVSHIDLPFLQELHSVSITNNSASIDGDILPTSHIGKELITELYKTWVKDYPKFYKMDILGRLGIVACEMLLKDSDIIKESTSIVLFNNSSSVIADKHYITTISEEDYYPSPSAFVYTLPNIVTGEIALKYGLNGETGFYILDSKESNHIQEIIDATMTDQGLTHIITGWIDAPQENNFKIELKLLKK